MHTERISAELRLWNATKAKVIEVYGDSVDEETLLDTLDGETRLIEGLQRILDVVLEAEERAAGAKLTIERAQARKERAEGRAKKLRELVCEAMAEAGLKTLEHPAGPVTRRAGIPSVTITDPDLVPDDWKIPQEPKIDRKAMLAPLKAGTVIPGAVLSNGADSLSWRRA